MTQTYNVIVTDHPADGEASLQATQPVAFSWGSAAAGTFTFHAGIGADTILNFQLGTDSLNFTDGTNYHLAPTISHTEAINLLSLITSTNGDAVIDFGHGDTVTFAGVSTAGLQNHVNHFV
jgi:hypothetical protein